MKAIQIVVDAELLRRVDRSAKRLKSSRSAAIRRLVAMGLETESLHALAAAEAEAYRRKPESDDERAAFRGLERSQARVLRDFGATDRW
jgi:hypothetical protein